jgi:hypothetical protein
MTEERKREQAALNMSIAHWEGLLEIAKKEKGKSLKRDCGFWVLGNSNFDVRGHKCPLCAEYRNTNCKGCPVFKKTRHLLQHALSSCYQRPIPGRT